MDSISGDTFINCMNVIEVDYHTHKSSTQRVSAWNFERSLNTYPHGSLFKVDHTAEPIQPDYMHYFCFLLMKFIKVYWFRIH